jgi:hypothetical protein
MSSETEKSKPTADHTPVVPTLNHLKLRRMWAIWQWTNEWNAAETPEQANAANRKFAGL